MSETPTSHDGAINQAIRDANSGQGPANTTLWPAAARDTYLATLNSQTNK